MNKLLFLCFVCLGLASVPAAENAASNPKALPANPTAGAAGAQSSTSGVSADYVLAPSDLIEVQIYGEPELLRDVRISRDDTIVLPLIGEIDLTAKTLRQAYLTDALNAMVGVGQHLAPVFIDGEWREIDTQQDLAAAELAANLWTG